MCSHTGHVSHFVPDTCFQWSFIYELLSQNLWDIDLWYRSYCCSQIQISCAITARIVLVPVDIHIHIHILIPMLFSLWFHYFVLICSVALQSVMVRDVYPICLFFFLKFASGLCSSFHECLSLCVFPSDICFLSVNELNFVSKVLLCVVGSKD